VSHFGCDCKVSQLLVQQICGCRKTELLFYETKDAVNRIAKACSIFEIQGEFENLSLWDTSPISDMNKAVAKVETDFYRTFYVEFSGVPNFVVILTIFEI